MTQRNFTRSEYVKTTSETVGIYQRSDNKKWMARITVDGKRLYIGTFKTESEAIESYRKKENELFKEVSA